MSNAATDEAFKKAQANMWRLMQGVTTKTDSELDTLIHYLSMYHEAACRERVRRLMDLPLPNEEAGFKAN